MPNFFIKIVFFILISTLLPLVVQAAKFYRFTDENGKMVVSSTLPPEVSQKGFEIVNEMGVVLQTIAPRKTEKQLIEDLANKAEIEEEQRKIREQQQLDTILINSYTDISDIERARDNEMLAKDRNIMMLKQNIRRLTRLLEDTQTRAARDERLGREVNQTIQNEVIDLKKRIAYEGVEVDKIADNKVRIEERYDSSIIRFSELKAADQLRRYRPGELVTKDSKAVIYQCSSLFECDAAWQSALLYANEHSTTELAWANATTIMMRKPRKDDDISIILTRVNSRNGQTSSLVMEVRCKKSQSGEEFCSSETVRAIEKGFIPFLN